MLQMNDVITDVIDHVTIRSSICDFL